MYMELAVTVAVAEPEVYPVWLAVMVDIPGLAGTKLVVAEEAPPAITIGDVEMLPTLGVPLVTLALVTLTLMDWLAATGSRVGTPFTKAAVLTVIVAAPVKGKLKLDVPPPPVTTKPDGAMGIDRFNVV
jgi:hypothetical protein